MSTARSRLSHREVLRPCVAGATLAMLFWVTPLPSVAQQHRPIAFLPPRILPRELAQKFETARGAADDKRYQECSQLLAELLRDLGDRDYAVFANETSHAAGFRSQIEEVFANADPALGEAFEQLYGAEARRELEQAATKCDELALRRCANRWFLTSAGQEARLLLARVALDRGQSSAAVRQLRAMKSAAGGSVELERAILLAWSLAASDRDPRPADLVNRTLASSVEAVQVGDQQFALRDFDEARRRDLVPSPAAMRRDDKRLPADLGEWLLHRGAADGFARGAKQDSLELAWRVPLATPSQDVVEQQQTFARHGIVAATVLSPLASGQQILARDRQRLHAFDALGRERWAYPSERLLPNQASNRVPMIPPPPILENEFYWTDFAFGRFSSDRQHVYLIEPRPPIEWPKNGPLPAFAMGLGNEWPTPLQNRLTALQLVREGALAWMVGGSTGGAESQLADVFFLSPVLPVWDSLFTVIERKGEIQLVALTPATGQLLWTLPLAHAEARTIAEQPSRRLGLCSLAFQDGILVCSTVTGMLAAVDVELRRLLWAVQFRSPAEDPGLLVGNRPALYTPPPLTRWRDCDLSIVANCVIVLAEDEELRCLDLKSGEQKWKRRRDDTMYISTAGDDRMLLVGEHRVGAIRPSDGTYAWPDAHYVAIPGGGSPSGRGVFDGEHYLLPTTDPELLVIDVQQGLVTGRHKLDHTLGNLIAFGSGMIAQNESFLHGVGNLPASPAPSSVPPGTDWRSLSAEQLVKKFSSAVASERNEAVEELLRQETAAVAALNAGCRHSDAEVAYRSAALLIKLLDSSDDVVRRDAYAAFRDTGTERHPIAVSTLAEESLRRNNAAINRLIAKGGVVRDQGNTITVNSNWSGQSSDLLQVNWIVNLESLELTHAQATDAILAQLLVLPQLKSLSLSQSGITNRGIKQLSSAVHLQSLLLQNTRIDDAAVKVLAGLTDLKALNLFQTDISADAVGGLRQDLPECRITH